MFNNSDSRFSFIWWQFAVQHPNLIINHQRHESWQELCHYLAIQLGFSKFLYKTKLNQNIIIFTLSQILVTDPSVPPSNSNSKINSDWKCKEMTHFWGAMCCICSLSSGLRSSHDTFHCTFLIQKNKSSDLFIIPMDMKCMD